MLLGDIMRKSGLFTVVAFSVFGVLGACQEVPSSDLNASSLTNSLPFEFRANTAALTGLVADMSKITPFHKSADSANISGNATTKAQIKISPLMSEEQAKLLVYIDLSTIANYKVKGDVPIWGQQHVANGTTQSTGVISSEIYLNRDGFTHSEPQYSSGVTSSNFRTVYDGLTGIGERKVNQETASRLEKNRKKIDSEFEQQVIKTAMGMMRDEIENFGVKANELFKASYAYLFDQHAMRGSAKFHSTTDYAAWAIQLDAADSLKVEPIVRGPADMSFYLHDGFLTRFIADNIVAGEWVSLDYFEKIFSGVPLPLAAKLPEGQKLHYPRIAFDKAKPLSFSFVDRSIKLSGRAHVITQAGEEARFFAMDIVYKMLEEDGKVILRRSLVQAKEISSANKSKSLPSKVKPSPGVESIGGFFVDVTGGLVNANSSNIVERMLKIVFAEDVTVKTSIPLHEKTTKSLELQKFGAEKNWLFVEWLVK